MPANKRQTTTTNKKPRVGHHPVILSAIGLTLLLLAIIIYPKLPNSVPSHYSADETSVATAQQQPSSSSNGDGDDNNPGAAALLLSPASAQPHVTVDPWLNGFPYRKPISISGSTSDLTQFQVNVTPYIYNETGLVGSWHFSESSGNATADSSGQGNTGYQYGSNRTTDGKFGNAMSFDGTDDYVTNSSAVNGLPTGNSARTVEAWIKPDVLSGLKGIVGYGSQTTAGGLGFSLYTSNRNLYFAAYGGDFGGNMQLSAGNWHHVVATYDGTNVALYVNGTLDTSAARSLNTVIGNGVVMGKEVNTANYPFNGTIDEVRIYNRTLSASEIQQQYQAKARLDYADVRFTDSDGATLLPFWMESDGKFWVKVPSIPTTGTTIYAYYGNPAATDAQNGTGTFAQFYAGGSVTGGDIYPDNTKQWDTNNYAVIASSKSSITNPNAARMLMMASSPTVSYTTPYTMIAIENPNANFLLGYDASPISLGIPVDTNSHTVELYGSTSQITGKIDHSNTATITTGIPTNFYLAFRSDTGGAGGTLTVNWALVRKYASPEPSAVNGTEESLTTMAGGAQNWTWKAPAPAEYVRSGSAQDWNWKPYQQYLGRYRKPMTIAGSTSALTDFQVNVTPYIYNETGLVGSWHFSESSGNATADSSGQGNTGYQYGTNRTTDGKFGNAMSFDGVDDYIQQASSAGLALGNAPRTIEAWIKMKSYPTPYNFYIAGYGSTGSVGQGSQILVNPSGHLYFDGRSRDVEGTWALSLNTWYHVAATYNETDITLYINGSIDTSAAISGGYNTILNSFGLVIGRYVDTLIQSWNGTIDEVRIYNRSLSTSEIQQQYQASKARLDYQDIRFTDSAGAPLPFWLERDGLAWVKVPSIPTTGTTIYAYYGNPAATDAQNGTGTFEFFDDFSGGLDKWTVTQSAAGNVQIVSGEARITGDAGTWTSNGMASVASVNRPAVLEWDSRQSATSPPNFDTVEGYSSGLSFLNPGVGFYRSRGSGSTALRRLKDGSDDLWLGPLDTQKHAVKIILKPTQGYTLFWNNTQVEDNSAWATGGSKIVYSAYTTTGGFLYADNVRVRKYASPEPSAVNGTEEDSPIPQNITVPLGGATNWTWYPS